ncbi:MAG TPA: Spy/CpxP family protein refolding chaperone [Sulfuricaulis sp.]|nr:Spy/CpxP family protein refolding chaperone [Sulfuricaulis sp.]
MRNSTIPKLAGVVFVAALAASAATTRADNVDDMMGGYGPGYGMGPGMGMMGGMSPGMMGGGYGGMGMMGMGPGMMGMDPLGMLDLSDEQRTKINKLFDDERKKHWGIMGKMMEEQNKMRDLYAADKPDPKKVGAVYGEIAKLQQQMIETHIQATNQMQDVLTKEQREQFRQWHRGGWGPRGPTGSQRGTMAPGMMGK